MRRIIVALAVVAGMFMVPTAASAAPDPLTCAGYPEPRVFVDSQSWWTQPGETEARHLHLGACIPEREHLSGVIHIDARLMLHNNPGQVTYLAIVVKTASMEQTYKSLNTGWTCPNRGNCTFWQGFDVPSSAFDHSGLEELRLRATAKQPDTGKEMRASLNWQSYIANGKSVSNVTRMPYLRGKGWYTGLGYCEAAYRSDVTPLPDGPVPTPTWSPWIRQIDHGTDDANPTHYDIRLDPDIHNGIPGTFLASGSGSRDATIAVPTGTLTSGFHTLFAHTECQTSAGINAGVLTVRFRVP